MVYHKKWYNIDCQKNLFVLTLHNIVHTTTSSSSECIIIINHPLSCSKNNIIHNGRILYYTPTYVLFQMWWMDIKRWRFAMLLSIMDGTEKRREKISLIFVWAGRTDRPAPLISFEITTIYQAKKIVKWQITTLSEFLLPHLFVSCTQQYYLFYTDFQCKFKCMICLQFTCHYCNIAINWNLLQ